MSGFKWGKKEAEHDEQSTNEFTLEDLKLLLTAYGKVSKNLGASVNAPPPDFTEGGATIDISNRLIRRYLNAQYRTIEMDGMTKFIRNNPPEVIKSVLISFHPELSNPEDHCKLITVIDRHIAAVCNTADTLQVLRDKLT